MSYIRTILNPGEKILCKADTSKIAYLNALAIFAALMHPTRMWRLARTELALTDKRIIGKSGGKTIALAFNIIEGVTVRRGLLGWMFDYGTIVVTANGGVKTHFRGIAIPLVFQQEAEQEIERAVLGHTLESYTGVGF